MSTTRIDLTRIPMYVLTCGAERKAHMEKILEGYNYKIIDGYTSWQETQNNRLCGAIGHARMVQEGLLQSGPFIILEDDCSWFDRRERFIVIPADADAIYIGLSRYGALPNNDKGYPILFGEPWNADYSRIHNMLATHAILINSQKFGLAYYGCMIEAATRNDGGFQHWDLLGTQIGFEQTVYAKKTPLFYQDAKYRGEEAATRFELEDKMLTKPTDATRELFRKQYPLSLLCGGRFN
jgi:hypothetical protein